ncbi:MAG TPA: LuxR C-terminal-related transcriptional regulator [Chitinophagaceae bacterium]|nr:LuxR C-terminal-related transcriptional regulator [Chitinophagaceae bacterium]
MNYSPLSRAGEKVISFVKEISGDQELIIMEDIFPFMDAMQKIFPQWVFMICPFHHPESRYISTNCEQVLGYTSDHIYNLFPAGVIAHAHEDDQQDIRECFSFLHNYLKESSPEYFDLRISLQFRFKNKNGNHLVLQDEKASLKLKNSTFVYYSILKDVSDETVFTGVKLDIYRQDASQEKLAGFRPSTHNVRLSKRETELVSLIRQGLRTKEIAGHLKISHHTVRNIRQRMFEKYNVNSSIELLNKAV